MHGHLGEAVPGILSALDEFQADRAAVGLELDDAEDAAADQPEVAVHVAELESEEELDDVMIDPADDLAVEGVGSIDLIAVDDIHVVAEGVEQERELAGIVLGVAVRIEDQLLGSGRETRPERRSVTPVLRMSHDAKAAVLSLELLENKSGRVR